MFWKSIDASNASKTADLLFGFLKWIVLMVGAENVVQIVTDNAVNYVAAGKLLEEEFPTLYWSPCVAHCLNLILKDFGELDDVAEIVYRISKISKFVHNHSIVLNFMRRFTSGRELSY